MHSSQNILDTIRMIEEDKLDVRTVTLGINLLDCADADAKRAYEKIINKITHYGRHLVEEADRVSQQLGVPIANKRVAVTPISLVAAPAVNAVCPEYCDIDNLDENTLSRAVQILTQFACALDKAGKHIGVDFIGGYSALVHKGYTLSDRALIESLPHALSTTDIVCGSVNIGSSRDGINMDAVAQMGRIIHATAHRSPEQDGLAAAKLVVFANAVGDNPFMAGAFHGIEQPDVCLSVGISGPGVIKRAVEKVSGQPLNVCAEAIKRSTFAITRMGQLVGHEVANALSVPFGIVDLSLAPTAEAGDSVGQILEELGVDTVGGHGTTAVLALLNDAVKKGGLMACGRVGGLSGSFIPVSEDIGMIRAAQDGTLTIDKLEAMTAICSVGLDMVAVPGDTSPDILSAIIADEAAIGVMNSKTTAVRIIPVPSKTVGDTAHFGGLLGYAPIMATHESSAQRLIDRGGFIPSPIHAFKN